MSPLSRRVFLGLGLGAGLTGASVAVAAGVKLDTYDLFVNEVAIPLPLLPPAFENYRIAFVSDMHIGTCANVEFLRSVAARVAELAPNLVLHGGDYLWRLSSIFSKTVLSATRGEACFSSVETNFAHWLKIYLDAFAHYHPPDGSFGVLGNHEGGIGAKICNEVLSSGGIKILQNQHVSIQHANSTLRIIGYEDYWTGIPRTPQDLPSRNPLTELRIALAHNPDTFTSLLKKPPLDFDVGLAGHTHGGQIQFPGIGGLFYNISDERFREGLWRGSDSLGRERAIFTSRGLGTVVVPIRVNCAPEIALITLVRA